MKTYENFIKDFFKKTPEPDLTETQEEIDKNLYDSVHERDYWKFLDAIKKGGNPNQEEEERNSRWYRKYTLLMSAINIENFKMIDELVKHGADVYHQIEDNYDIYEWANTMLSLSDRPKIKEIFLKYHPDFFDEREFRKTANKYNL
jgi:hypothetical protein